jgi:ribonuclease R
MAKKSKKVENDETLFRSSKEERLYQNLLRVTLQYMQGKGFISATESDLMRRLSLPPQHAELFREVLKNLIKQKSIELVRGEYRCQKDHINTITGIIRMHARGFGFVVADNQEENPVDIFIPKPFTMNAVDGDHVEVQINTDSVSEKGPEGRVITILVRGRSHMAGIIRSVSPGGEAVAYVPMLGPTQRVVVVQNKKQPLKVGDRIVMEVVEWGEKETETVCKMSEYIGHISDTTCDIPAAIREYELRSVFSPKVMEEAASFGKIVSRKDMENREDLRDLECFTIDPDTAKDFDDALSLTKDENGHYHLGVHIADVSHYVSPGSALDEEAKLRCNSTYFPGQCVPMLPGELSNNLCSLKANVNRLTASVMVHFDSKGNMLDYRMARTVIKSAKRFTYREAKEVLDGKRKSQHLPKLNLMVELCKLLKKKRYERGSIEFSLPELVVKVDEKGVPTGTDYVEYDVTHQLVEEFMLKANELVAFHLSQKGKNLTFRIHDVPAEENLKDFSILAGAFGFQISSNPTPSEMQKLFDEAITTPYGPYLATSYIRRMRLAAYSVDNIGHYGLGLTHYCHFTSPIRRYVDLVVHRILFGHSDERIELTQVAQRCSDRERISAKAENSVVLLKKMRLLDAMHTKEPLKQYEAVVTKVKNFGIYFEVLELMLEGFLHVSELENDYYVYEEDKMRLRGTRHNGFFSAGERITVMLKSIDLIVSESKWNLVSEEREEEEVESRRSRFEEKRRGKDRRGDRKGRSDFDPKAAEKKAYAKKGFVTKKTKPIVDENPDQPSRRKIGKPNKPNKSGKPVVSHKTIMPSRSSKPVMPSKTATSTPVKKGYPRNAIVSGKPKSRPKPKKA